MKKMLTVILTILIALSLSACSALCEHVESDWIIDEQANAYKEGSKHTECVSCGEIIQSEIIPKFK